MSEEKNKKEYPSTWGEWETLFEKSIPLQSLKAINEGFEKLLSVPQTKAMISDYGWYSIYLVAQNALRKRS